METEKRRRQAYKERERKEKQGLGRKRESMEGRGGRDERTKVWQK